MVLSGVMLPTVAVWGGEGVGGGNNAVVDYSRVLFSEESYSYVKYY